MILLLSVTLLYPDTLIRRGLEFGNLRLSPLSAAFVVSAPAVLMFLWAKRRSLHFQLLDYFLLAAMAYIVIRGAAAASTANGLFLVFGYAGYALLMYYGMAVIGQKKVAIDATFVSLAVIGIIISVYAIIEFVIGRNILFEGLIGENVIFRADSLHRTASTLGGPGILGTVMVQLAPFFIFFFIRAADLGRRFLWGTAIVVAAIALWVSYSKISIGTTILFGAVLFIWRVRHKESVNIKSLFILIIAVVLAISILVVFQSDNAQYNLLSQERTDESFSLRWYLWEQAPHNFTEHPLFGAGMWHGGPFSLEEKITVDNQYLITVLEQGLVGAVILAGSLFIIGGQAWRTLKIRDEMRDWALPVVVSMGAIILIGLTSNPLYVWPNMVVFWLEAGLIRAIVEKRARTEEGHVLSGFRA